MNINGTIQLSQLGIIKATGPDAANFLNGQLSINATKLGDQDAKLTAYCSPQGKMLASFIILKLTEQEFLLLCSADLLEATLKRLSMYILRAKVQLSDVSHSLSLYGLVSTPGLQDFPACEPWTYTSTQAALRIAIPHVANLQRYIDIGLDGSYLQQTDLPHLSQQAWAWLEVSSGVSMVTQATRDKYIPQMLNYESIGAIDFAKGCYPGQEVISRSQFRGTLKRRLHLVESQHMLTSGEEIFSRQDSAGEIIAVAHSIETPNNWRALAVLRSDMIDAPLWTASPAEHSIEVLPLPYALRDDF